MAHTVKTHTRAAKATKFAHRLWHWTCGHENLFLMDKTALAIFAQFCLEASK